MGHTVGSKVLQTGHTVGGQVLHMGHTVGRQASVTQIKRTWCVTSRRVRSRMRGPKRHSAKRRAPTGGSTADRGSSSSTTWVGSSRPVKCYE
eukprot:1375408-Pyramimonas_sp.AAC.1